MPNTWLNLLNVDCYSTFLPFRGKKNIWLEWNCRTEGGQARGMWNQCCAVPLRPQVLTGECQFSNWRLVFPSFPFWAWLFRSNQAIVVLSLCGPGLGSYGQLLPSHQTFSQSFSSTGQPRGPLEPPQIIKPWSLSCLRPAPPLRPSAALGYKEVILLHMV